MGRLRSEPSAAVVVSMAMRALLMSFRSFLTSARSGSAGASFLAKAPPFPGLYAGIEAGCGASPGAPELRDGDGEGQVRHALAAPTLAFRAIEVGDAAPDGVGAPTRAGDGGHGKSQGQREVEVFSFGLLPARRRGRLLRQHA